MSVQAISWAFQQKIKDASPKLVLLALANFANDDGVAYPSYSTLQEVTSRSRQTISNSLEKLVELELLVKADQDYIAKKYNKNQNCYILNFDKFINEFNKKTSPKNLNLESENSSKTSQVSRLVNSVDQSNEKTTSVQPLDRGSPTTRLKPLINNNKQIKEKINKKENDVKSKLEKSKLSQKVKDSLADYFTHREELAKSNKTYRLTEIAINRIIKSVESNKHKDDDARVEAIDNAIASNWKGIFPVKENKLKPHVYDGKTPDAFGNYGYCPEMGF
ncbi:helix-turn-helix domain-containing protein [Francisella philomiragia]|uniref:Helix-turn-helix domain protein n=1 Tax=Francisella philomiragia TaxID=28110 RepID=A0A0B6CU55_9GAMM|nr:helix-turn-helix domain-containing protein [Francisella philomiragia]AJI54009.1 helix-turn-helix domain protein [Francisella philomiragia]